MSTYKTFRRSCLSFEDFAKARNITVDRGLTYDEARRRCAIFNENLSPRGKEKGTKLEFTQE